MTCIKKKVEHETSSGGQKQQLTAACTFTWRPSAIDYTTKLKIEDEASSKGPSTEINEANLFGAAGDHVDNAED
jgi:hypothetical protein